VILVDSHCHIDFEEFDVDRIGVLERSVENKVAYCLVVSVEASQFESLLVLVQSKDYLFASAGIHPNSVSMGSHILRHTYATHTLKSLMSRKSITFNPLIYVRDRLGHNSITTTEKYLHFLDDIEDDLRTRYQEEIEETAREAGGVMHCFTEDVTVARAALELGFYISLSGIVTFKNATAIQAVAKYVPEDRLLIETDSPYLAPVPRRGKRNEPGFVYHTAVFISELRGVEVSHLADITTRNFFNLFRGAKRDLHWETLMGTINA